MTSKEALGTLTFVLNQLNGKPDRVVNECYDVIEKYLELLEIIKKYAYEINFANDNEETERVKEWIVNDK